MHELNDIKAEVRFPQHTIILNQTNLPLGHCLIETRLSLETGYLYISTVYLLYFRVSVLMGICAYTQTLL